MTDLTDDQISAAATLQQIGEEMINESTRRKPDDSRIWNPSYIRRQGRRLLAALETLTEREIP